MITWEIKLAALAVALATLAAGFLAFVHSERTVGAQQCEARVAVAVQQDQAKAIATLEAQRKVQDEAQAQLTVARAATAAAVGSARRLQQRIDALVASARAPVAERSASAPDSVGLLADVLRRADERAGLLADYADQARIAGLACEQSYDALK